MEAGPTPENSGPASTASARSVGRRGIRGRVSGKADAVNDEQALAREACEELWRASLSM